MNISFTKKCVWQIKNGSVRSFNKDSSYKVEDSLALEIISAGYAFKNSEKECQVSSGDEGKKSEKKKEKKSIKDYVKKVISSDEDKSKDDNKKSKSKKNK